MAQQETQYLSILGAPAEPSKRLETFPNRTPGRFYAVRLESREFTCLCPKTGQPDFAEILVRYVPDAQVVESKSFKLYLASYRNEGVFHEHVTNRILDDLVAACAPHWCEVTGRFSVRGGVAITVVAEHTRSPAARDQWR
jgi:7-cyano-7-deazaguanine reductase